MKYVTSHSMENCLTPEALELLAEGLKSFIQDKTYIDDTIFDEISREARSLSNLKLNKHCKSARKRCREASGQLEAAYAACEKRRSELSQQSCSPSSSSDKEQQMGESEADEASEQYLPLSSMSAPATPALCLRCNGDGRDLKRRSQSLEDDMANRIHQYILEQQQHETTSHMGPMDQLPRTECTEDMTNEIGHITPLAETVTVSESNELVGEHEGIQTVPCLESAGTEPSSESTELYDSGFETPERLLEVKLANLEQEVEGDAMSQAETIVAADEYTLTSETTDTQSFIEDNSLSSTPNSHYSTVDRGDKFIELTHNAITIPIEDFANLNNNSMKVESPTLENGLVKTYMPHPKPNPAKRSILASSSSTHSSLDSDTMTEEQLQSSGFVPRVRFEGLHYEEEMESESKDCLMPPTQSSVLPSQLSPVLSTKQKQTAMQKRRSFHGFTSSLNLPLFNHGRSKKATEDSIKRLSIGSNVSESRKDGIEERLQPSVSQPSLNSSSEKLAGIENSLRERENHRLLKNKRLDKTMSLVTASSDSLPR